MKRIFHSWDKWEDYQHNFYGGVQTEYVKDNTLHVYAEFLKDLPKFESALNTIIHEWKFSCEHNLTNEAMNRVAYLGQASFALTFNVPHNQSMGGYNLLSDEEKKAADAMAQKYLDIWLAEQQSKEQSKDAA